VSPFPLHAPPLVPDRDEARELLAAELAQPQYLDPDSWFQRLWRRLLNWVDLPDIGASSLTFWQGALLALLAAAVVAVLLLAIAGPLRRDRRRQTGALFDDADQTAKDLRAEAEALAGAGEWAQAALQRFRALVRSLCERAIVYETPGLTAHEAVGQAVERLEDLVTPLWTGADRFDALAYGGRPGSQEWYEAMVTLDADVAAARPSRPATAQEILDQADQPGTRVTAAAPEAEAAP